MRRTTVWTQWILGGRGERLFRPGMRVARQRRGSGDLDTTAHRKAATRILTYNVHRWLGTDRQIAPGRIADVIAACGPDVVALQEVRVGRVRSGGIDQAAAVAVRLGMDLHFQPTIRVFGEQFGIAVLSRHPSRVMRSGRLPSLSAGPAIEKRSALWVQVELDGWQLNVVNAHLSLRSRERLQPGRDPRRPRTGSAIRPAPARRSCSAISTRRRIRARTG